MSLIAQMGSLLLRSTPEPELGWIHVTDLPEGQGRELTLTHSPLVPADGGVLVMPGRGEVGDEGALLHDIFLVNTAAVYQCSEAGSARYNASFFFVEGALFRFGGFSDEFGTVPTNDLLRYNATTDSWEPVVGVNTPSPRGEAHTFVDQGKVYLFNGSDGTESLNDLHTFDEASSTWIEVALTETGDGIPQFASGVAIWKEGDLLRLLGVCYDESPTIDSWEIDLTSGSVSLRARSATEVPHGSGFAYIGADSVVSFGGFTDEGGVLTNDLVQYSAATLSRVTVSVSEKPTVRNYHGVVTYSGHVWVVAGSNEDGYLTDVWKIPVSLISA